MGMGATGSDRTSRVRSLKIGVEQVVNWCIIDGKLVVKDGQRTKVVRCPDEVLEAVRRSRAEQAAQVKSPEPDGDGVYHITTMDE